ncbi:MAG: DUF2203 domain-containing protein [Gemmatales bacterium]|nr:DUF2203 domain-containing protein [Gemmatales bacterium]MDW8385714.1 DUF2203 family protein [Gemmatales bacterium]
MSKSRNRNTANVPARRRPLTGGITLEQAQKMLPLVRRIVADIQNRWSRLSSLETEQLDLDRRKRTLDWPQRSRRYEIAEEIAQETRALQEAVAELERLDLVLVDAVHGEVAFPTIVKNRRAYFLWRAGEPEVKNWCYAHDPGRHPVDKEIRNT